MLVTRNVWMKYRNPNNGEGNDLGGSGDEKGSQGSEGSSDDGKGTGGATGEGENKGDGKPSDAEAKLLKEVMDKKTKLKAAEDKSANLEARLREFDGIDPVAVKALLKQQQDSETAKLEEKGEWTRLKSQIVEAHGKEIDGFKGQLSTVEGENAKLRSTIAELTVGNAFATSSFIKEDLTLPTNKVRVFYGSHFEFSEGKVVAFDKPAGSADRTPLVDAKGDPLGFEDALKKIVDADPDRDQILKSKMKAGAGSKTTGKEVPNTKIEEQRGVSRIIAALDKGALAPKK